MADKLAEWVARVRRSAVLLAGIAVVLALSGGAASAEVRQGTEEAETLTGTNSADRITGGGGNDALKGKPPTIPTTSPTISGRTR